MPRFTAYSSISLGILTLSTLTLGVCPAQAQSSLVVGYNAQDGTTQFGQASVSNTGTTVAGQYWFYGDDLATANSYYYLETDSTSIADISGGTVTNLYAADSSVINIYGGAISSLSSYNTGTAFVFGGTVGTMNTVENGIIDLMGTNLTVSSIPDFTNQYGYGTYYTVSGTLQNGQSPFTAYYDAGSAGTLEFNNVPVSLNQSVLGQSGFNPVPEASTITSFSLLLALGGVMLKRKKAADPRK